MQISKESWHYRLLGWMGLERPNNLCGYVGRLVFAVFVMWPCIGVMLPLFGGVWLLQRAAGWLGDGTAWLIDKLPERPTDRPRSLLREWAAAKKAKMCPRIEFID